MKQEIQKILFETELPIKECEALTQELLNLFSVSQQRELLIDCVRECLKDKESITVEQQIDTYLRNKGN